MTLMLMILWLTRGTQSSMMVGQRIQPSGGEDK